MCLANRNGSELRIVSSLMQTECVLPVSGGWYGLQCLVVHEDCLYTAEDVPDSEFCRIRRIDLPMSFHHGECLVLNEAMSDLLVVGDMAVAPSFNQLFIWGGAIDEGEVANGPNHEVVVVRGALLSLDMQSLNLCHTIPTDMALDGLAGLAMVDDVLYAATTSEDDVQGEMPQLLTFRARTGTSRFEQDSTLDVHAGSHADTLPSWRSCRALRFSGGLLHLLEEVELEDARNSDSERNESEREDEDEGEGEADSCNVEPLAGRRIFTVSPQGEVRSVHTFRPQAKLPQGADDEAYYRGMCISEGQLVGVGSNSMATFALPRVPRA